MSDELHPIRDVRLADLARRQGGVVSAAQLHGLGYSRDAIRHMVSRGRLHRLHRGVYAVGHQVIGPAAVRLAAVLAVGNGALVARRSAAAGWDIRQTGTSRVDVLAPRRGRRDLVGIDVHVSRRIDARDATLLDGVPITTVARTIADLAGSVGWADLRRTMERADARELLDVDALLRCSAHRAGAPRIRAILDEWAPAPTNRGIEERLLELVRRTDLPEPLVNAPLHGFEVDLLWDAPRLVVEADSRGFHNTWAAAERDRHRDAILAAHGFRVLRFTWSQVTTRQHEVITAIRAVISGSR